MVIEVARDAERSIIEVRHILTKEQIESVVCPEKVQEGEVEAVKNELLEDYPDYSFCYATKSRKYLDFGEPLGKVMVFVARGIKYFSL